MPTAEARPWPSGPVVISTPLVWRNSGWPGVFDFQVRSDSMSVELQPEPAQVQLDVQGEAAVPAGQHEPVAAQPVRVAGVVAHQPLKQGVRQRRQAHRRARVAVADLLHRIGGQHPDGVHRARVQLGPVVGVVGAGEGRDLVECGHVANSLYGPGFAIRMIHPSAEPGAAAGAWGTIRTAFTRGLPSSVVEAARCGEP